MNTFGRIFRISIYGESHGSGLGVIIDGLPSGIPIKELDFEADISRRRGGQTGTTPRKEMDVPRILSGVFKGYSSGTPLHIRFENTDVLSSDYDALLDIPRPGHADLTAHQKYHGFQDHRGGGHFSGRLTLALIAAGVLAKKMIHPVLVKGEILEIGGEKDYLKMVETIGKTGDSIGGLVQCTATGLPAGWGEPFFDSVESVISHLIFSIPAIKGIEFGSGFQCARMKGSEHNDPIIDPAGKTLTNHAGGVNGGITNGNELVFRVAVKPTSSIALPQHSIDLKTGKQVSLEIKGRHDTCIALRMPVILESVTAIALADFMLVENARSSTR